VARDPDVPRLPRGRGIRLSSPQLFKIVFFAALLVAVIMLQRPCSEAAGNFVGQFDDRSAAKDAAPATLDPQLPPGNYVELKSGMTDEEIRKAIEKASEPSAPGSAGAGSGTGSASAAHPQ
jgi:hypothetical protein